MVVAKYSYKLIFIASALGYNLWVAVGYVAVHCPYHRSAWWCNTAVVYTYIIAASALCGLSAAHIWIAQGAYVDAVAST